MNTLRKIASVLTAGQKIRILILFLMTIILTFLEILSIGSVPILVSTVISGNAEFIGSNILNQLISGTDFKIICLFVVIIFILKNLFVLFYNYFNYNLNYKININLSKKIFKEYLYSNYLTLSKIKTSDMIRNLTTEVGGFVSCINNFIAVFRDAFLLLSILILIIAILDFKFFLIFSVFLIITLLFYLLLKNFLKKIGEQTVVLRSKYIETVTDSFQLIKEIIINAKRNFFINKYYKNLELTEKNNLKSFFIFASGKAVFEVIAVVMMISIILFLYNKEYEITFIISYLSLIGISIIRSMPLFNSILTSLNKLEYKKPSVNVIINLIEFTKNNKEQFLVVEDLKKNDKEKIAFNKNIKINNLTFKYNENVILDSLSLEINKGEKIALVGPSGSGKTTLTNILSGLIKLKNKELLVDDVAITENNYKYYREIISLMPQESYLMNETIENNIFFGSDQESKETNMTKIQELLNTVNAIKFINNLIKKEKEIIKEGGTNISGGEKQRILFARSLYKKFELLILDEPTSSLDKENSFEIVNNIFKKYQSKTILMVTHKIDDKIKFDRILLIENGKIKEYKK